jgi:hypothetical protein
MPRSVIKMSILFEIYELKVAQIKGNFLLKFFLSPQSNIFDDDFPCKGRHDMVLHVW